MADSSDVPDSSASAVSDTVQPSSVPDVNEPSSDAVGAANPIPKDPFVQPIDPTSPSSVSAHSTTAQSKVSLYGTYSDTLSTTEQFPMQHATKQLPASLLALSTTDYTGTHTSPSDSQSADPASAPQSLSMSTDATVDSAAASGTSDITPSSSSVSDSSIPTSSSTDISAKASSQSSKVLSSKDSDSDGDLGQLGTDHLTNETASIQDNSELSMTPPSAISPHHTANSNPPLASSDYVATTGAIVTPLTASKTSLSSSAIALDTVSVKTTSTIPLTSTSAKPIGPSDAQGTSILGGGLSDYIVYVGAPLCGLGILILLIVCILCLRKRKAKSKGSPAKTQVQDLWVNSQAEIPLSNRSPLLEARGVDRHHQHHHHHHLGVEDLANSKLRRRVRNSDSKKKQNESQKEPSAEECKQQRNNKTKLPTRKSLEATVDKKQGTKEGCSTYEAVFDFPAEQDTHLCLHQGDLVKVTRKEDNGWWRGTIDNRLGWFPSNYVQPALQDTLETENEVEMHNESNLSSFLMKKSLDPSPRSSFGPSPRNSYPTEEEIEAEPIYCKIQPKDKRKSTPKVPDKITAPPPQLINRENTPIPIEDGSKYRAIYDYNGHFHGELHLNKGDIIQGKEQDRNGWMNGFNETSEEEGWFPAVYVEQVLPKKAESPTTPLATDPASYKQLEANTMLDGKQDLVGIVHKAVHNFTAEKAGDLEFNEGDLITVVQVLENGWWLGCKDKTVGWFPGTFVQMIDQPSGNNTPSPSPINKEPLPLLENGIATPTTQKKSKLRPARKAPPPPVLDAPPQSKIPLSESKVSSPESRIPLAESKIPSPVSKIPKKAIPVRPAPQVPSQTVNKEPLPLDVEKKEIISDEPEIPDYNYKPLQPLHDGLYDLLDLPEEIQQKNSSPVENKDKPQVPKRYIKPKLVMIPRSQVKLPENRESNGQAETPRSRPPPPRPNPPRLGPIRAKLQAPRSPGHQSEEEEETGFFHLNHQSNVNDFLVREDSSEPELDNNPYQSLSSFGLSSFGSTFGKKEDSKVNGTSSPWNKSPTMPETTPTHKFGSSFGVIDSMDKDVHTLNDTSPVVLNDDAYSNDDEFVINCKDIPIDNGIDYKYGEDLDEPVIPLEPRSTVDDYNTTSPDTAEIAVTPTSPKKKEKSSRLAPPKPVTLAINKNDQSDSDKPKSQESSVSSSSPALTKIPRAGGIPEPVSKLPTVKRDTPVKDTPIKNTPVKDSPAKDTPVKDSPAKDTPVKDSPVKNIPVRNTPVKETLVKTDEPQQVLVTNSYTSPSVYKDETINEAVQEIRKPVETVSANSVNNSPVKDDPASLNSSFDDSDRERAGSFGADRPPLAPKPKPKSLPKLLPKPKAVSKPKESDIEKDIVIEKEPSKESRLPTTPTVKSAGEVEEKPKEDEPKQTKLPMSRGRKSQIPASPGLKKKKQNNPDSLQDNRKLSESEDSGIPRRKISESDSDVPLSPVTNIRKKPESPAIARRVKKGEGSSNLRNRSNSPHGRTGIPVNLKQRSNSPASKLPRSGIPKSNLATPSPTSNGPSAIVPSKANTVDHSVNSPSSGPNTPQVEKIPSPEQIITPNQQNNKPERPSKPPQKQKSQDGKPSKGKSLLPIIHKNMDAAAAQNGVSPSPGSKPKRGIPVAKPPRPPGPKSPAESEPKSDDNKRTLYQAVRGYVAQNEFELSFTEGTFIKELSDCDRPGWYVGMLADGTTGLYPASHFKPSPVSAQSEA